MPEQIIQILQEDESEEESDDESYDPVTMEINTDKSEYKVGEDVIISGNVSQVIDDQVSVVLLDSNDEEVDSNNLKVDKAGNFKGRITLKSDYSTGLYILEATYADQTESTAFLVEGDVKPTVAKITLSTDREEYIVGNDITISGQVILKEQYVKMQLLNPANTIVKTFEIKPNQDGSFTTTFKLDNFVLGTYTLRATYSDNSATATFVVLEQRALTVKTQQLSYTAGSKVIVTGSAPFAKDTSISIKVQDAGKRLYLSKQITLDGDTYSFDFNLNKDAGTGTYTITVTYGEQSASTTFELKANTPSKKSPSAKTSNSDPIPTTKHDLKQYNLQYSITNAQVLDMGVDEDAALMLNIESATDGELQITLPRELIDAKVNVKDVSFKVLIDGKRTDFQEVKNNSTARVLKIPFPAGSIEIKIIGTPEKPKAVKTMLAIDSFPDAIRNNDKVTFSGVLKTVEHGYVIKGAKISLKHLTPAGSEITLGSGVTGSDGIFTVEWVAKDLDDERFNVFAVFDGYQMFAKTQGSLVWMNVEK
jgi:hypothetical protein